MDLEKQYQESSSYDDPYGSAASGGYDGYSPVVPESATLIPEVQPGNHSLPSGNDVTEMDRLGGWNWGAFLMGWIWLVAMKPLYGVIGLVAGMFGLGLFVNIYLGIKGNQLAWAHRPFKDREEFNQVMRAWTVWGVIILVGSIVLAILGFILLFVLGMAASSMD